MGELIEITFDELFSSERNERRNLEKFIILIENRDSSIRRTFNSSNMY